MRPASYQSGFAPRDGIPAFPSLWNGCVGAWAPCLGPSGLAIKDWSSFGNHGILTNMDPAADWVTGRERHCLDLDGSNDFVDIAESSALSITSEITLSAFVFSRAAGSYQTVLSKRNGLSGGRTQYGIGKTNSNTLQFFAANITTNAFDGFEGTSTIALNNWFHIAATFRNSSRTCNLYVNGKLDRSGTTTQTMIQFSGNISIGKNNDANFPENFNGLVDDLRIYRRILTANEIRILSLRRGIAYELAPRRRASSSIAFNRRRRLLVGAGS